MDLTNQPRAPILIDPAQLEWETWPGGEPVDPQQVRWKLLFSSDRTNSRMTSMGLAEIAPEGILPRHRHAPPEIYYGLSGTGRVETDFGGYLLHPGCAIFIPSNSWHETRNVGDRPLTFLFTFPEDDFAAVEYEFAQEGQSGR